jgi:DNA polymerase-3 subunit delta'
MLPGTERHPHARAVLAAALPPEGRPSHAYLFHGPAGAGKREAARAFAAVLLSEGAADPANARTRVEHGVHPDLTWVKPSGAADMLVSDVDEPVVLAATRTPFESSRRVFVIERADAMNDQAANRMLKTLEEPPSFAHLLLLTNRLGEILPTIASRCQHVRFDAPSSDEIAEYLGRHGVDPQTARACARLALGDSERALGLALGDGPALRAGAEAFARAPISGVAALAERPWLALLDAARRLGAVAEREVAEQVAAEAEYLPAKDAKRLKKPGEDAARRAGRRARTGALDQALQLAGLWLRDVACVIDGAPEVVHNSDREAALREDAARLTSAHGLRTAVGLVDDTRAALTMLNATEELALETLASRIERELSRGRA